MASLMCTEERSEFEVRKIFEKRYTGAVVTRLVLVSHILGAHKFSFSVVKWLNMDRPVSLLAHLFLFGSIYEGRVDLL